MIETLKFSEFVFINNTVLLFSSHRPRARRRNINLRTRMANPKVKANPKAAKVKVSIL